MRDLFAVASRIQQGIVQNARQAVIEVLKTRFGIIPENVTQELNKIYDHEILHKLLRAAIAVSSVEEFEHSLR
jgi:hypothetical protein